MSDSHRQPQFRRIAIIDFLILTLTVSLSMAVGGPVIAAIWKIPAESFPGSRLPALVIPPIAHFAMGLNLFGLAVLARERVRSRNFQWSPGHWYFIIAGSVSIIMLLSELLYFSTAGRLLMTQSAAIGYVIQSICYLGVAICYLGVAISGGRAFFATQPWRWRVCFGLLATALLIWSIRYAFFAAEMWRYAGNSYQYHLVALWSTTSIASCLAAIIAFVTDIALRVRRDWLHYVALLSLSLHTVTIGLSSYLMTTIQFWRDVYSQIIG